MKVDTQRGCMRIDQLTERQQEIVQLMRRNGGVCPYLPSDADVAYLIEHFVLIPKNTPDHYKVSKSM